MSSPAVQQQSFMKRLRDTPKSLRRKFEKSASTFRSSSPIFKSTPTGDLPQQENGTSEFVCRYLGERTVYTLKPDDCYEFARKAVEQSASKSLLKVVVTLTSKEVEITFKPGSPILKSSHKSGSRFTPPIGSPRILRKNLPFLSSDESIPVPVLPTTIFDRPLNGLSPAEKSRHSYVFETNNNNSYPSDFVTQRRRSNTFDGIVNLPNDDLPKNLVHTIPLHEIAYCVTVPDIPHVFLLTSRGKEGLLCRALLFQKKEKAQAVKVALAQQFQIAYLEWQANAAKKQRRRSSSCPTVPQRTEVVPTLPATFEISDDELDDVIPEVNDAMNREFNRRASCMAEPGQLCI